MADLFWRGADLCVEDVGGCYLRVTLLSLEPGSRIWLSLDGDHVQFERVSADAAGDGTRRYRATGSTAPFWNDRAELGLDSYISSVEIVERPDDRGAAGIGFYRHDQTTDLLTG